MANTEIELNPVDFITIGTVGPKGQRVFHLQAGKNSDIVTLTIEKEQASALSQAINELLSDLDTRYPITIEAEAMLDISTTADMSLREPIEPKFRVAQMGLGYDEERDMVVLVAQELMALLSQLGDDFDSEAEDESPDPEAEPGVVRMWCSRHQIRALSRLSSNTVESGRPEPKLNGRLVYYWT